jgi:hypothetical protein
MSHIQIKVVVEDRERLTFPYPNFTVLDNGRIVIKNSDDQPVGAVSEGQWVAVWAERLP